MYMFDFLIVIILIIIVILFTKIINYVSEFRYNTFFSNQYDLILKKYISTSSIVVDPQLQCFQKISANTEQCIILNKSSQGLILNINNTKYLYLCFYNKNNIAITKVLYYEKQKIFIQETENTIKSYPCENEIGLIFLKNVFVLDRKLICTAYTLKSFNNKQTTANRIAIIFAGELSYKLPVSEYDNFRLY